MRYPEKVGFFFLSYEKYSTRMWACVTQPHTHEGLVRALSLDEMRKKRTMLKLWKHYFYMGFCQSHQIQPHLLFSI